MNSDLDRNGNGNTFAYAGWEISTITDGHGRVYTAAYTTYGALNTITGPDGRSVTYTQDSGGNLASVTDAAGNITNYSYPSNELDVEDPNTNVTTFNFGGSGVTVTLPETSPNTVTYAVAPAAAVPTGTTLPTGSWNSTITDANSNVTTYTIAYGGAVLRATDPLNHYRGATYSPNDDILTATDAVGTGNTTNYGYDAATIQHRSPSRPGHRRPPSTPAEQAAPAATPRTPI